MTPRIPPPAGTRLAYTILQGTYSVHAVTVSNRSFSGGLRWKLLLLWQAKLVEPEDHTGFGRAPGKDRFERWE